METTSAAVTGGNGPSAVNQPSIWDKLAAPFDRSQIHIKIKATSEKWQTHDYKGKKVPTLGLPVAYLDARDVMDRLDAIVTPGCWEDEYGEPMPVKNGCSISCRLTIETDGKRITKQDFGIGKDPKDACSDALKRAAVKFGVGRFLYRLGGGRYFPLTENGRAFDDESGILVWMVRNRSTDAKELPEKWLEQFEQADPPWNGGGHAAASQPPRAVASTPTAKTADPVRERPSRTEEDSAHRAGSRPSDPAHRRDTAVPELIKQLQINMTEIGVPDRTQKLGLLNYILQTQYDTSNDCTQEEAKLAVQVTHKISDLCKSPGRAWDFICKAVRSGQSLSEVDDVIMAFEGMELPERVSVAQAKQIRQALKSAKYKQAAEQAFLASIGCSRIIDIPANRFEHVLAEIGDAQTAKDWLRHAKTAGQGGQASQAQKEAA